MTYNLFISHSWVYSDAYSKLMELLSNAPYFNFKNYVEICKDLVAMAILCMLS